MEGKVGLQQCKKAFISRDLPFMCEHEFNLVVLMPVKPLCRASRAPCRSFVHTSFSAVASLQIPLWPARTNHTGRTVDWSV